MGADLHYPSGEEQCLTVQAAAGGGDGSATLPVALSIIHGNALVEAGRIQKREWPAACLHPALLSAVAAYDALVKEAPNND